MPRLVMTMLVRDEIDIIAANLDFHLRNGVDHVVVIDNGSVDGTRDVLSDHARKQPVTLVDEAGRDFDQSAWMTKAAILARDDHGADWILHNDADEFWLSPDGALTDLLHDAAPDVLVCDRLNMLCPWEDIWEADAGWVRRCVYRVATPIEAPVPNDPLSDAPPCPYFYRRLLPKVLTRADGLIGVKQGNHGVRFSRSATEAPSAISIFHYPIRSLDQFRSKIENGGRSYESNKRVSGIAGWHWRRWRLMLQTEGAEAALADALPSRVAAARDLADGSLVEDRRMLSVLSDTLPVRHPPEGLL